jgi:hypothetical protein
MVLVNDSANDHNFQIVQIVRTLHSSTPSYSVLDILFTYLFRVLYVAPHHFRAGDHSATHNCRTRSATHEARSASRSLKSRKVVRVWICRLPTAELSRDVWFMYTKPAWEPAPTATNRPRLFIVFLDIHQYHNLSQGFIFHVYNELIDPQYRDTPTSLPPHLPLHMMCPPPASLCNSSYIITALVG